MVEITVHAGRKFNHPFEQYSNLSPAVTLRAVLDDGEDAAEAVRQLQNQAEVLVQTHKESLLRSIEEDREARSRVEEEDRLNKAKLREIDGIEETLKKLSSRLEALRSGQTVARMRPSDSEDIPF